MQVLEPLKATNAQVRIECDLKDPLIVWTRGLDAPSEGKFPHKGLQFEYRHLLRLDDRPVYCNIGLER